MELTRPKTREAPWVDEHIVSYSMRNSPRTAGKRSTAGNGGGEKPLVLSAENETHWQGPAVKKLAACRQSNGAGGKKRKWKAAGT